MGCQETDNDDIYFDYLLDSPELPLLDNLILNPQDTFLSSEVLPIGPPSTPVDHCWSYPEQQQQQQLVDCWAHPNQNPPEYHVIIYYNNSI